MISLFYCTIEGIIGHRKNYSPTVLKMDESWNFITEPHITPLTFPFNPSAGTISITSLTTFHYIFTNNPSAYLTCKDLSKFRYLFMKIDNNNLLHIIISLTLVMEEDLQRLLKSLVTGPVKSALCLNKVHSC